MFTSALWITTLAPRAKVFRWLRPRVSVGHAGDVYADEDDLGVIEAVLVPVRARKVMDDKLTHEAADAVLFTPADVLAGDFVERDGERWEVLTAAYWPEQAITVAEVRHARGA